MRAARLPRRTVGHQGHQGDLYPLPRHGELKWLSTNAENFGYSDSGYNDKRPQ